MMNSKLFFPALFHKEEDGSFWISFPDLPGVFSQGKDMDEAYKMACEALSLALDNRGNLIETLRPTPFSDLVVQADSVAVLIEYDSMEYRKKHDNRAVKKTLSIPSWLNDEAMSRGVNFSQVLQDALKERLGLS